jgi:1,4-dihydroxy-2-naphthoate octaprenyltransferase
MSHSPTDPSSDNRPSSLPASGRPSALPSNKRKPRYVLGTFWIVVAIVCFIAGFSGLWWALLIGIACVAYAIYLYRGGRFGFWFF